MGRGIPAAGQGKNANWHELDPWVDARLAADATYLDRGGQKRLHADLVKSFPHMAKAPMGGFYSCVARVKQMRESVGARSAPRPPLTIITTPPPPQHDDKKAGNGHTAASPMVAQSPPSPEQGVALVGLVSAGAQWLHACKRDTALRDLWELMQSDLIAH